MPFAICHLLFVSVHVVHKENEDVYFLFSIFNNQTAIYLKKNRNKKKTSVGSHCLLNLAESQESIKISETKFGIY